MSVATRQEGGRVSARLQTIGAVCRRLKAEFPDISISKIRYLEDQGLISPKRTPGGYRLFGEEDVDRLETILRLQRDEFLPLRVIKKELTSTVQKGKRRQRTQLGSEEQELSRDELCRRAGVSAGLVRDLEEFGLLTSEGGRYRESDADLAAVCARLASYGVTARHLRAFQSAAERTSGLLGQITAPALHARNAERRQAGLEDLRELGELSQELSQLLLWRSLRRLAVS